MSNTLSPYGIQLRELYRIIKFYEGIPEEHKDHFRSMLLTFLESETIKREFINN